MTDTPFEALIAKLVAGEGSRELDVRITAQLHPETPVMTDGGGYGPNAHAVEYTALSEMIEPWTSGAPVDARAQNHHWDSLGMTVDAPHYTTSIDAKLPGENIVEMSKHDGVYRVWHADEYGEDGRQVKGEHKIEAIARRIAALRARARA